MYNYVIGRVDAPPHPGFGPPADDGQGYNPFRWRNPEVNPNPRNMGFEDELRLVLEST